MKLYYSPGACSLSPHIVAREAGIPVELQKVDLRAKTLAEGASYTAVNGKGYVPAVELPDGSLLTEGPVIVQYMADQKPESGLAPKAGTAERYRLQEWLNFITSELHKQFSPLFNPATPDEVKEAQRTKIAGRFDWLDKQLEGKDFLLGKQFTVADAYLFTVVRWSKPSGIDLAKWPVLAQYVARVAARPQVQAAMKAEGLPV